MTDIHYTKEKTDEPTKVPIQSVFYTSAAYIAPTHSNINYCKKMKYKIKITDNP